MKQVKFGLTMILLMLFLAACQTGEPVTIGDEQLEEALRQEIEKEEGDLYEEDFEEIEELDLSGNNISDISDLVIIHNLQVLSLEHNEITDITPLQKLENLNEVNVEENPIESDEQLEILDQLSEQGVVVHQTEETEVVGRDDGPGGFLWKVENEETTVYLQGTVHVGPEEFYPMHTEIENAYAESDVVVPEIDITSINPFEMQETMMELGTYQDGTTIEDHIPEDVHAELVSTLEELGFPYELAEMYKPWILSSTIQQFMTEQLGYLYGVDEYFLTRASEDGKDIIDLETAEGQLSIFADTSDEYQIEMLKDIFIDLEDYDEEMQALLSAYAEGDIEALLALTTIDEGVEMSEEDEAFMKAINDDRNYGMAETISEFLEEENDLTYFVIVGTLHLIEEPHIISILEEDGYEAEHIH
ncbi:TraB/GumN family protein [Virgibacillus oceani]